MASSLLQRFQRLFQPSHQHTAFSATILLVVAIMASRVVGYVREAYIAYAFGAGPTVDAYVAGFTIPDWLNYIVAGGTASITFVSIYSRFLAAEQEEEAQKTFSVIITVMTTVLTAGVVVAEIFTPQIERAIFPNFSPQQLALCVYLTRILLPAQIFFYVGGVVSAVLLARRMFLFPAFAPLLYNVFIILGGVVLGRSFGIASLAYGAVAGAIVGPFLVNAMGAAKVGTGFRISFDVKNPAFREWVSLTIPLMLGVSLVTADDWILRYFASGGAGDIARLNYAKRLIAVPIAVLGQAIGQASLPFFARLFGEKKMDEFAATVNGAVYRTVAASLLVTGWMMAASLPLVDLVYRRGLFSFSDSRETALFFFWFALSLACWAAQGLYARAYYAAGNTFTPMVACSLVTLASLPVYTNLFHRFGVTGLVAASDIGILANTLVLAWLLHRNGLVRALLPWGELAKVGVTAVFAGAVSLGVAGMIPASGKRLDDLLSLGLVTLTWAGAVALGLLILRSRLPGELRHRGRLDPDALPIAS